METFFLESISDCENVNKTNFNCVAVTFMSSRNQAVAEITHHMWDTKWGGKCSGVTTFYQSIQRELMFPRLHIKYDLLYGMIL